MAQDQEQAIQSETKSEGFQTLIIQSLNHINTGGCKWII